MGLINYITKAKVGIRKTVEKLAVLVMDFILPRSKMAKKISSLKAEQFLEIAKGAAPIEIPYSRAVFSYKDPLVKDAIWLLKYRRDAHAARLFGEIGGNMLGEWLEDLRTFENFEESIMVPVPMWKGRRASRGGNHTEILCAEILKNLPLGYLKYEPGALSKIKDTPSQAHIKNRALRLKNPLLSVRAAENIVKNKNIVLIDDVITTGATANECRAALIRSGAKRVIIFSIAH